MHPNNMNRENGLVLSTAWSLFYIHWKKNGTNRTHTNQPTNQPAKQTEGRRLPPSVSTLVGWLVGWLVGRSPFIFIIKPLKMDLTEGSETSAKPNLTRGNTKKKTYNTTNILANLLTP
jgi:hypothetical protein